MSKFPTRPLFSFAVFKNLKVLACSAIFVALSIICGKYLAITGDVFRFSFENLPIILSGILFGPLLGALTGFFSDFLGCILVGYAINPLVMAGAISMGLISGFSSFAFHRLPLGARLSLTVFCSHLIGSVILKTLGLAAWYDFPIYELMLWRLINYVIVGALEFIILYAILKSKAVTSQINSIMNN